MRDALNHVTTYTYNALNQCVSVKDALNNTIHYGYDARGRRTTVTDAKNNTFTTTYDGNGNVIKTTDAKGNTISETAYNALNKPLTVTDAMGKSTTYTYNELGLVETVTDSMNHVSEYTYNSRGQNTAVRNAANGESKATYDLLGNITRLEGPLGGATTYAYDDMGRLISETTTSGGTKSYEYNELNVRKKVTNARSQIRQIFYDAMGRITGHTSPEGAVSYTYDANGNVLTVSDSHGTITRTYDALNRVTSYTDVYNKVIRYEYDAVGTLSRLIYPDNTAVAYEYDSNHNLVKVTDWANRVTVYTYDENNRVVGVTKPDGSVTTTAYDNNQRVTSTVERTASGVIITGFEYIYDDLSRIIEEKALANSIKMCYTYDSLGRVTARTVKKLSDDSVISTETFTYDAAGNITGTHDSSFRYDINNRLISFNGNSVSYDLDGNMLSNGVKSFTYDSANRLITADGHTYTYDATDVRIRNLCADEDTSYTYDPHAKLSRLLCKTTNCIVTKYVYGRGLIGEEANGAFKTYHFDARGSTIAVTDANGNITDTFAYDTYGKLISRTGTSKVIFGYNGRDGVVTDDNGLIYMRTRYYSPEMKRFVNADIVAGQISNAVTLNRFAYANGNPVSFVDPFGLSVWSWLKDNVIDPIGNAASTVGNAIVDGAQASGEFIVNTATTVGNAIVDGAQAAGEFIVDTAVTVGNAIVDGVQAAGNFVVDTANNVGNTIISGTKAAANWTNENVIKPVGKAVTNAGRQIKDGFNAVVNAITDNVGAKASAGKEKTINTDYYFFATVEEGIGYSKDFGNEKPVTFFASAGENWWEFWEWSVGIDVKINGYGAGISIGTETSLNIHAGDVSHEVGVNALGRISHKVAYNVGDGYVYTKYSLNGPETALAVVGVAALIYYAPGLIPAIGAAAPALSGAT